MLYVMADPHLSTFIAPCPTSDLFLASPVEVAWVTVSAWIIFRSSGLAVFTVRKTRSNFRDGHTQISGQEMGHSGLNSITI